MSRFRDTVDRMPLRVRLVLASTLLVMAGLAVSGLVAAATLRGYLVNRVDAQLSQASLHSGGPAFGAVPDPDGDGAGPQHFEAAPSEFYTAVYSPTGTVEADRPAGLGPSSSSVPQLPSLTSADVAARGERPFTVGSRNDGTQWRVIASPLPDGSGSVLVAQSLSDVEHTVGRLQLLELLIGLGVVVVLVGVGYVVVRRSLRPLTEVEHTAAAIADGDLTQRVPSAPPGTEVGRLSAALNTMLNQIEKSFLVQKRSEQAARRSEEQMRQFVADASHELRTPLTSIRGFAELFRQGAVRDPDELQRAMRRIEDEAKRMGVLVDDLLLLARLDQQRPLERKPVDLAVLAADAVEDARMVAPDRTVDLELDDETTAKLVVGDELRLRQVLGNLVGNALTHTPAGTPVTVRLGTAVDAQQPWVVLEVSDHGPGLSPEQASRVFERFYRVDAARTRDTGGTGLGLSIVAGLADAHGGRVEVDTALGAGATFRVWLPLSSQEEHSLTTG